MSPTGLITSGRVAKVSQLAEGAIRRAVGSVLENQTFIDNEILQKMVVDRGGEFGAIINRKVAPLIEDTLRELTFTNVFADEELLSDYGYLSGYALPNGLGHQLEVLREHFPNLRPSTVNTQFVECGVLPAEKGLFYVPRWQLIAPTYNDAVVKALDALRRARKGKLDNPCEGRLGPEYLRETDRKRLGFEKIAHAQPGQDILVVAAQFGLRHRGRSVRRARAVMLGNEFGLGAFEVLIMLLTHPERLQHYDDLWLDCAGDEYSPCATEQFEDCPYLYGKITFNTHWFGRATDFCGSVSAFLPR